MGPVRILPPSHTKEVTSLVFMNNGSFEIGTVVVAEFKNLGVQYSLLSLWIIIGNKVSALVFSAPCPVVHLDKYRVS
jgi:hypothetical protein